MSSQKPSYEELEYQIRQLEERLESQNKVEQQEKYQSLFENINVGVALHEIITDENNIPIDFIFLDANPAYEKLTLLKLSEIKGKRGKEVIPTLEQKWINIYGKVAQTGEAVTIIDRSDYLDKYWEVKAYSPKKNQFAVALTDVTKRVEAEKSLKLEKEKAQLYLDVACVIIIALNKKGEITLINQKGCEVLGYRQEEILGKNWFDNFLQKDDIESVKNTFNEIINGKMENVEFFENSIITKEGKTRYIAWHNAILRDTRDNIIGSLSSGEDITENKRTQQALLESEERFSLAMQATNDGLWDWDINNSDIYFSPGWKKMLGYKDEELKNDFDVWGKLIDQTDDGKFWKKLEDHISGKLDRFEVEFKMIHKDGHKIDVLSRANALFGNDGEAVRVVGTHVDITERKQVEEAKKRSEERLRSIFRVAPAGIGVVKDRVFTEVNAKFCEMTGYTQEELKGKNARMLYLTQEEYDRVGQEKYRQISENETGTVETSFLRKDGSTIDVILSSTPININDFSQGITFTALDITDRKKSELALKQSEERYRTTINALDDYIHVIDKDLKLMLCNDKMMKRLEELGTSGNVFGKQISEIFPTLNADKEKYEEVINSKTGSVSEDSIEIENKETWTETSRIPVLNEEGEVYRIVTIIRDITERKTAELVLKNKNEEYLTVNEELNESLERIQKLNKDLKNAKVKAEESDRLKSAFLANMSHEIRTPMNGIIGFSEMFTKPGLTEEKRIYYSKIIIESSNQLLNIVNDILDISIIETGELILKKEQVDVNELLTDIFDFFAPQADNKDIKLLYHNNFENRNVIETDKVRLRQIFSNLMNNALKFTSKGFIKMGYKIAEPNIIFYVEDSGIGIAKDKLEAIFERFRQEEVTLSRQYGGTGLGLSISQKLTGLLGGRMWVDSEKDKGSTFYFTIPFNRPGKKINEQEKAQMVKIDKKLTILVAEDEEVNFLYIKEVFSDQGIKLLRALNGIESVEICKSNPNINLVLMDVKMPLMNGFEATKKIKELRPDLPIIAQTAYAMVDDEKKALAAGCDGYLPKPINAIKMKELINKISK